MRLLIDPPVTPWHPEDAIRDWIVELADMRDRHRGDDEALACIARAEHHAAWMLDRSRSLPKIEPPPPM
jgi:hypothetical protein